MKGDEERVVERSTEEESEFDLERRFAERAYTIEAGEEIPGRYGHGAVREINLGEDVDQFEVEAPDGSVVTLQFDSQPQTKLDRPYAFLSVLDTPTEYQLDAIGEGVPFIYVDDYDRWLPIFPRQNRRRHRLMLRLVPWLLRTRLFRPIVPELEGDEENHRFNAPRVGLRPIPYFTAAFATIYGAFVLGGSIGVSGAVGLLFSLFLLVVGLVAWHTVQTSVIVAPLGTVHPYDSRSPRSETD